jgi:hypothetical protein
MNRTHSPSSATRPPLGGFEFSECQEPNEQVKKTKKEQQRKHRKYPVKKV